MEAIMSYKIAESIKLRELKVAFPSGVLFSSEKELFYQIRKMQYISILSYGVVCFYNVDENKMADYKKRIMPFCENKCSKDKLEEFYVDYGKEEFKYYYHKIEMPKPNLFVTRLVMFHVAQSLALTCYFEQIKEILEQTNRHTSMMGKRGIISLKGRTLKKFLGKNLQIKNQIVENLFILDTTPGTDADDMNVEMDPVMKEAASQYIFWKAKFKIDVDHGMKEGLIMKYRAEMIYEEIKIIKEQIEFFNETLHHNTSVKLEWVIIVLVAYEVIDLIINKI